MDALKEDESSLASTSARSEDDQPIAAAKNVGRKRTIDESQLDSEELKKLESRRAYNRQCAAKARKRSKELVAQLQSQVEDLTKEKGELKRSNDVMKAQLELLEQQNRALMMNQLTAQVGTQQQLNTLGNQLGNLSSNLNTNNLSTNVSAAPILATNNLFVAPNAGLLGAQPTMAAATNPMLAGALTADPTSAAVTNPLMAVQMGAQGTPNPAASQPALLERLLAERLATQQNPLAQNVQGLVSAPGQTFVATDLQGSVMGPVDGTSFLG